MPPHLSSGLPFFGARRISDWKRSGSRRAVSDDRGPPWRGANVSFICLGTPRSRPCRRPWGIGTKRRTSYEAVFLPVEQIGRTPVDRRDLTGRRAAPGGNSGPECQFHLNGRKICFSRPWSARSPSSALSCGGLRRGHRPAPEVESLLQFHEWRTRRSRRIHQPSPCSRPARCLPAAIVWSSGSAAAAWAMSGAPTISSSKPRSR